jgi:hypothetical protein
MQLTGINLKIGRMSKKFTRPLCRFWKTNMMSLIKFEFIGFLCKFNYSAIEEQSLTNKLTFFLKLTHDFP